MAKRYIIVECQWFFNDEFWSALTDDWGAARVVFETEEAAQSEVARRNRDALRAGKTPLPSGTPGWDDSDKMATLLTILGLQDEDQITPDSFRDLSDVLVDEILTLFKHAYFEVQEHAEPEVTESESWHLLIECYPDANKDGEPYEHVISMQPTQAAAEQLALEFNREAFANGGHGFPENGTLEMARLLAEEHSMQFQDIRECPGMEALNDDGR